MSHTDPLPGDAVELHNPTPSDADIGDWWLTDDFDTPQKFRIPAGTVVPAGGFVVFYQSNSFGLGPNGFAFSSAGDQAYLFSGNAAGELTGYFHGFDFGAQFAGASFGRYVISTGADHLPTQVSPSLGGANAGPRVGPVVISEIHYHPPDLAFPGGLADDTGAEYIELHDLSGQGAPLFDVNYPTNSWRLRDAVDFVFPPNTALPAGGFALVVSFDPADAAASNLFASKISLPLGVPVFGPFLGKLDNSGASVELIAPDQPHLPPASDTGFVPYVLADKVKYSDNPPWPALADGLGPSLQRIVESSYGNDPSNWQAASGSPGASYQAGPLPLIVQHPQAQTNVAYRDVVLNVAADSPTSVHYQWRLNGAYLAGATNATLLLSNAQPAQAGAYSVVVWNTAGAVASETATLSLLIPARILAQPTNAFVRIRPDPTAAPTTNATFRVTASGSSSIRYQWRCNGLNLPSATNSTLTISNVQAADWGEYTVTLTDEVGTLVSDPAWLYPLVKVGYAVQPLSQSVAVGGAVTLSCSVTGWPPPITYEWRRGSVPLATNVLNEFMSFFSFSATNIITNLQYRVVVRHPTSSTLASSVATVTTLADQDGDGIPDQWWADSGLSDSPDALADPDGDGMLNQEEYHAGTDPTNRLSRLHLDWLQVSNGLRLGFEAASNKTYSIQYREGLGQSNWVGLASVFAQSNSHAEYFTNSTAPANRLFRVITPHQP
jgi:hypothetical protein